MLNFAYDVPVKLFSTHLLAMSLFLHGPGPGAAREDVRPQSPVEPVVLRPLREDVGRSRGDLVLRTLVVVGFTAMALYGANETRKTFGDLMPRSPLYGIWNVEEFEVDGERARRWSPTRSDGGGWSSTSPRRSPSS